MFLSAGIALLFVVTISELWHTGECISAAQIQSQIKKLQTTQTKQAAQIAVLQQTVAKQGLTIVGQTHAISALQQTVNQQQSVINAQGLALNSLTATGSKRVAFSANGIGAYDFSFVFAATSPLILSNVLTNVGNGYSGTTGIFTAPFNGTYLFGLTTIPGASNVCQVNILHNGARVAEAVATISSTLYWVQGAVNTVLTLIGGDQVSLQIAAGGADYPADQTSFIGILLF